MEARRAADPLAALCEWQAPSDETPGPDEQGSGERDGNGHNQDRCWNAPDDNDETQRIEHCGDPPPSAGGFSLGRRKLIHGARVADVRLGGGIRLLVQRTLVPRGIRKNCSVLHTLVQRVCAMLAA